MIELLPIGTRHPIVPRESVIYERRNTSWCVQPSGLPCWIYVDTEEKAQKMCAAIAEVHP